MSRPSRPAFETVKEILRKHYVHRNEAGLVRSNIREKGRYKVIDKISVALNDKADVYEAEFSNLGIRRRWLTRVRSRPIPGCWSAACGVLTVGVRQSFVANSRSSTSGF